MNSQLRHFNCSTRFARAKSTPESIWVGMEYFHMSASIARGNFSSGRCKMLWKLIDEHATSILLALLWTNSMDTFGSVVESIVWLGRVQKFQL